MNTEKLGLMVRVVVYLMIVAGAFYTLKSDVQSLVKFAEKAEQIHSYNDERIKKLEQSNARREADIEYIRQSLERIEKKLDRR